MTSFHENVIRRIPELKSKQNLLMACAGLLVGLLPQAAFAQTSVYRELILSIDVSGSISTTEFNLQKSGWYNAFSSAPIKNSLLAPEVLGAGGTAVGVAQWSSFAQQQMVIPTMAISDEAAYNSFLSQLNSMPRLYAGNTCVSCGMDVGINDILTNAFVTPAGVPNRQIIDLSGDGANNSGPAPSGQRTRAEANGIVINALAIEDPALVPYFQTNVATIATAINGGTNPGFVEFAGGFANFEAAANRKLYKELQVPAGLPFFGVAAAFGSIRKLRQCSADLQRVPKA